MLASRRPIRAGAALLAAEDGQIDRVAATVASGDLVPTVAEERSDQTSGTAKEKKGKLKDLFDK